MICITYPGEVHIAMVNLAGSVRDCIMYLIVMYLNDYIYLVHYVKKSLYNAITVSTYLNKICF